MSIFAGEVEDEGWVIEVDIIGIRSPTVSDDLESPLNIESRVDAPRPEIESFSDVDDESDEYSEASAVRRAPLSVRLETESDRG